ncbi:MAG: DUF1559 domain-containing protein [Pirellula sp.]|jgi:prepilin-type N-terminal cleavage/methylation domain-containing protein
MQASRKATGFTLIELIVVIAVLTLLVALVFPALNAAREASRVGKCKSNLRQIGLAVSQFRTAQREFPSCGWGSKWYAISDLGFSTDQPGGWFYRISPFLEVELNSLHPTVEEIQNSPAFDYSRVAKQRVPIFHCPSKPDRFSENRRVPVSMAHGVFINQCHKPDYALSLGPWRTGDVLNSPYGPQELQDATGYSWPNDGWLGIAKRRSGRKENEILDGESQTILAGEKRIDRFMTLRAGDDQPYWTGCGKDTCRWTAFLGRDFTFFYGAMTGFGSSHGGFTVFVRCDGSVHSESNNIDPKVLDLLGDIAGGQ